MNRFVLRRIVDLDARAQMLEAEGHDDQVVPLREEVCRLVHDHLGASHLWRISRLFDLATSYRRSGQIERAERLYLDAIRKLDERDGSRDTTACRQLARGLNSLGVLYCEVGRELEAIELLQRALALSNLEMTAAREPARAAILSNLASAYQSLGQLPEAEAYCREALGIYLQAGEQMVTEQIHCYCDLAELSADAEQLVESVEQAQEGLALADSSAHRHDPIFGEAILRLGFVFRHLQDSKAAVRLFERAAQMFEQAGGAYEPALGRCLDALSDLRQQAEPRSLDSEG